VWGGDTTTTVEGTLVENNVYSFTISSNYQNVLFKNTTGTSNWDKQTADAGAPQSGKIFVPSSSANRTEGSWNDYEPTPVTYTTVKYDNSKTNWSNVYAYVWTEGDSSVTPVVLASTSVSGNTYTFSVASTYKNILFKNTNGTTNWDQQTADATVPSASGYTFVTDSGNNKTSGYWSRGTTPVTYKTVKYDNSKTNWSNVYAYVWTEGDSSVAPVVLVSTSVSGNTYTFSVASTYEDILFKNTDGTTNWDQQTADATVPATDGYTFITYSGNNKTGGYWSYSPVIRRALTYGVSDQDGTSQRHYNDAVSSAQMYEHFTYDGEAMESVECATNLTIAQFKEKVRTTFADTTDDDISYMSIACHGGPDGSICLGTNWTSMTGAQFRALLDECIKGEVVLLLDCCYSGQIIDKETDSGEFSAEAFLEEFLAGDSKSGELAAERFHVICASSKTESSWGYRDYEVAVQIWEQGLGWLEQTSVSTDLNADANGDNKVTLAELYDYSYPLVLSAQPNQHVVVYPENDDFVVGGRY